MIERGRGIAPSSAGRFRLMPGFFQVVTGSSNRAIQASFSLLHKGLQEFMTKISWAGNLNLFR